VAFYAIDRFEGATAIVIADAGQVYEVPRSTLPKGSREGTVLEIQRSSDPPDWSRATINEAERTRRLDRAREALKRLGETDPGGDVTL
jgi:hypothetical protein